MAGCSFDTGSSRRATSPISRIGIAALVVKRTNEAFGRNSVSYATPSLECAGLLQLVDEGGRMCVELDAATSTNMAAARSAVDQAVPPGLLDTLATGGADELDAADGCAESSTP